MRTTTTTTTTTTLAENVDLEELARMADAATTLARKMHGNRIEHADAVSVLAKYMTSLTTTTTTTTTTTKDMT